MSDTTIRPLSRRQVLAAVAVGASLLAPSMAGAQAPLTVKFVQQRGLLYLPIDMMVTGGILQKEATKLGLGKVDATVVTLSGPGPVTDALLSGAAITARGAAVSADGDRTTARNE